MLSMFVVFSTLKFLGYLVWPWYIVCIPLYYLFFEIVVGLLLFVWTHKTFKNILGSVSNMGIPKDMLNKYLKKGYSMNDRVGISYLEYTYDDILKGEKSEYRVNNDKSLELIKEEKSVVEVKEESKPKAPAKPKTSAILHPNR